MSGCARWPRQHVAPGAWPPVDGAGVGRWPCFGLCSSPPATLSGPELAGAATAARKDPPQTTTLLAGFLLLCPPALLPAWPWTSQTLLLGQCPSSQLGWVRPGIRVMDARGLRGADQRRTTSQLWWVTRGGRVGMPRGLRGADRADRAVSLAAAGRGGCASHKLQNVRSPLDYPPSPPGEAPTWPQAPGPFSGWACVGVTEASLAHRCEVGTSRNDDIADGKPLPTPGPT